METQETALETVPHELLLQRDPDKEIEQATTAAKALKRVIDSRDDRVVIRGKTFLRYEDWQTVGQFYGYSVQTDEAIACEIEGVKGAKAKAILLDRNGNLAGGAEAYCMRDEAKWAESPWFQLASMAQTRAGAKALRNRLAWVAVLAGYEGTPAEEMTDRASESNYEAHECPECGGEMWDNRTSKKNPRAPDFKCKDKTCNGAIWPEKKKPETEPESSDSVLRGELFGKAQQLLSGMESAKRNRALDRLLKLPTEEMAAKVQELADTVRAKGNHIPKENQEVIAAIRRGFGEQDVDETAYLAQNYPSAHSLEDLKFDQLVQIQDELIPF